MDSDAGETITVKLTSAERQLIVDHVELSRGLESKLRFGLRDGDLVAFRLTPDELEDLAEYVAAEANHAPNFLHEQAFSEISDRLEDLLAEYYEEYGEDEFDEEGFDPKEMLPPGVFDELLTLVQEGKIKNEQDIEQAFTDILTREANDPVEELGGLSPRQLYLLIGHEWGSPSCALRFRRDLPFEALGGSELFANVRILVQAIAEEKKLKSTAKGNLTRAFVESMLIRLRVSEEHVEVMRKYSGKTDEQDFRPLHLTRIHAEDCGLIRHAKGYWSVTKKGHALMAESAAGELYALLFDAYFRKFNLSYLDRMYECDELQNTIAYSMYHLSKLGPEWHDAAEIAERIVLPTVEIPKPEYRGDQYAALLVTSRIFRPLLELGLLESDAKEQQEDTRHSELRLRKTPLFDQFLTFDFEERP